MPPKLDKESPTGRINVPASDALVQRVEDWRARGRPIPSKAEAARLLIDWALENGAPPPGSAPPKAD